MKNSRLHTSTCEFALKYLWVIIAPLERHLILRYHHAEAQPLTGEAQRHAAEMRCENRNHVSKSPNCATKL
ncbi:protein of unknown function [Candidatus Filomicrobium marinum]|uniref:Uncharacterized protein n=1 Tax=Candidatus Filomicrobium marinum TaxID=1608628 RepID=A0A0D6JCE6_9HYPH|nr:protein of unknown function [Candidatus Filomicrobium marinum]CPR16822.1 protein of unknown function [Candidatus Filomicrobium marinum]